MTPRDSPKPPAKARPTPDQPANPPPAQLLARTKHPGAPPRPGPQMANPRLASPLSETPPSAERLR
eukprot:623115-Alexandrium_andersonii.AAC.1